MPNICKHRSSCVTPCGQMWRFLWQSHQLTSLSVTICVKQSALVIPCDISFKAIKKYHLRPDLMWHFIVWLLTTMSRLPTKACHVYWKLLDWKPQNEMYRKLPVCKSEHKSFSHLTYLFTNIDTLVYFCSAISLLSIIVLVKIKDLQHKVLTT